MSDMAHKTTETQSAVIVSDHWGVLLRISTGGLWVNPDIPADECAQRVLASLRPILSHTIDTEVQIQVARLTAERDAAQAEVERLTARQTEMETHITGLTAELHRTRADGIKLRWVQGKVERLTAQRDAAQAEVERLTAERDEARTDRDAAQRERERVQDLLTLAGQELSTLREALRVRRRDQSAQNLDMVNGQAILDSSRPDDETIWREAFMAAMERGGVFDRITVADVALAEYRKRWPR